MVYEARIVDTGELVAIKKVLQDKRFKVRVSGFGGRAGGACCWLWEHHRRGALALPFRVWFLCVWLRVRRCGKRMVCCAAHTHGDGRATAASTRRIGSFRS